MDNLFNFEYFYPYSFRTNEITFISSEELNASLKIIPPTIPDEPTIIFFMLNS